MPPLTVRPCREFDYYATSPQILFCDGKCGWDNERLFGSFQNGYEGTGRFACKAARHAGVLPIDSGGVYEITRGPNQDSFEGVMGYGAIRSEAQGPNRWNSYRVRACTVVPTEEVVPSGSFQAADYTYRALRAQYEKDLRALQELHATELNLHRALTPVQKSLASSHAAQALWRSSGTHAAQVPQCPTALSVLMEKWVQQPTGPEGLLVSSARAEETNTMSPVR